MMTVNDFKIKMESTILEFSDDELSDIWLSVNYWDFDSYDEIENNEDFQDGTFLFDACIVSLLSDLNYNGFTEDEILSMTNAQYGRIIEIYYHDADKMYSLWLGVR